MEHEHELSDVQLTIDESKNDSQMITSKIDENVNTNETTALFEQPSVLQGKRSRKVTARLEIISSTPSKKDFIIPKGNGKALAEIEYIQNQIAHGSTDALTRLHQICFGRRGTKTTTRKNLREFRGFEFQRESEAYQKHLKQITKLKKDQLRSISDILGLTATGRNTEHAERILNFLLEPTDDVKRMPKKKGTKKRRISEKKTPLKKRAKKSNAESHVPEVNDMKMNESKPVVKMTLQESSLSATNIELNDDGKLGKELEKQITIEPVDQSPTIQENISSSS